MVRLGFGVLVLGLSALPAWAGDGGIDAGASSVKGVPVTAPHALELRGPDVPSLDLGEANGELGATREGEELNLGWALARTALVLGIVVLLIYLTLNVGLRRLLGIKPNTAHGLVTVLERVTLDPKRALFVVRAGNEVLLLGGSDASLQLISKLDVAQVDQVHGDAGATATPTMSPLLQKLLGARKKS